MKLIDYDAEFQKYLLKIMRSNAGKYTEQQLEDKIPDLYRKFGNEGTKTLEAPFTYYGKMSGEALVDCLCAHVEQGVSVSDFLCEQLEKRGDRARLAALIDSDSEELSVYAINILRDDENAEDCYFKALESESEHVRDTATEMLSTAAERVKERTLALYKTREDLREYLIEILAQCRGDERIFQILCDQFLARRDEIPRFAQYLSRFGDERAVKLLLEEARREEIDYVDYKELRCAIEALGGECPERDFSHDTYYKLLKKKEEELQNTED